VKALGLLQAVRIPPLGKPPLFKPRLFKPGRIQAAPPQPAPRLALEAASDDDNAPRSRAWRRRPTIPSACPIS